MRRSLPSAAAEAAAHGKVAKKVLAKQGTVSRQWNIMKMSGIPEEEIPAFQDASHWLGYFPPRGKADLKLMGSHVDWRRSFITTDVNPYYDSFVRWQFNTLRRQSRLHFGKRPVVYSVLDGQACADHDRASGEGVGPQEYTLIKLRVLELPPALAALEGRTVFLVAATLRPETMYGQTNCFVLPDGDYGAFEMESGDVFVCSERSARNMAHQNLTAVFGETVCLASCKGTDLLGVPLRAPMAAYDRVYCLPLLTISMGKGTGVVTSVPSDAPDDYAALRDLKEKAKLREKFGIADEMVLPYDVVEIIDIPGLGRCAAATMCDELAIRSQNDKDKLAQAKERTYLKGFYEGVMLVGSQKGQKVCDAKLRVREEMLQNGTAVSYLEPESRVESRSGDECVVALADQWYITYGEEEWRQAVEKHVHSDRFTAYSERTMADLDFTLGWLHEWGCSRSFGLGTRLPCDEKYVIESLSDSTIYMAYYTVAHLLQGGAMDGSAGGPLGVAPHQVTDAVWDHVFLGAPVPADCDIPADKLAAMRREFEYWYPMDLRVSGKDLIKNHLTMSLYNHVSIWAGHPDKWPRSFYCNGHVMIDSEKMSKSKGNFLTLRDAVDKWSADAMRFALADAGDGLEDANYGADVANMAILRLVAELEWTQEQQAALAGDAAASAFRHGDSASYTFLDRVFEAEVAQCVADADAHFTAMRFKDAIKAGWHELHNARDLYRDACAKLGTPMHATLVARFLDVATIVVAPICPHWAEHVWCDVLGHGSSVTRAPWPQLGQADPIVLKVSTFFRTVTKYFRDQRALQTKARKGKPGLVPTRAVVLVAAEFPEWQQKVLHFLHGLYDPALPTSFPQDVLKQLQGFVTADPELKRNTKNVIRFGAFVVKNEVPRLGADALATSVPFDEAAVIRENAPYIALDLDVKELQVFSVGDEGVPDMGPRKADPVPGRPIIRFFGEE